MLVALCIATAGCQSGAARTTEAQAPSPDSSADALLLPLGVPTPSFVPTPDVPPVVTEAPAPVPGGVTPADPAFAQPVVVTPSPTHACPTGTAPSVEITSSEVQPDPLPDESDAGGHQYKVTATGTVTNGATAPVDLGYAGLTVTVRDMGDLYVSDRPTALAAMQSVSWQASRDFLFYDDPSLYRPYLSGQVTGWRWSSFEDRNCPSG